ncbi:MAG TPA: protease pro-enzyme activation domain-containing protein, partial [Verrucomicrobiae bacterium]|nr:protease pro-enzyme activation domain-containing protein [Verrucomicrobiae bacterium]
MIFPGRVARFLPLIVAGTLFSTQLEGAEPGRRSLHGHVPKVVQSLTPLGRYPETNRLWLAIGLPLRNQAALNELLHQLYDPHSTNFHKFLTPQTFTARFGPTESQYQSVMNFAESNGLTVTGTHPNRLVLDVEGSASNIERAFQITLRIYHHPTEPRDFVAPGTEPSVPTNLPVADIGGLSDFSRPKPLVHIAKSSPLPHSGSGPSGRYMGKDFRNAYAPGTSLTGAGQTVGLLQFDGYN